MSKINKKLSLTHGRREKAKNAGEKNGASVQQSGPRQKFAFQEALALHQTGRLLQAEALYRKILAADPEHADALHYLGLLAHQTGKSDIAVQLIHKAISSRPDYTDAYNSLGVVLNDLGKLQDAVASYRKALSLKPDYPEVLSNLGNVLMDQGKLDKAAACFRQALSLKPEYAELYFNLGNALKAQAKLAEAVDCYQKALSLRPDYAATHYNLACTFMAQGRLDEAGNGFLKALSLKPDYADAHYNLGNVFKDQGKLDKAVGCYQRALSLKPDNPDAHFNLGITFKDQGKLDEAVSCYRRALSLNPDYAEVHNNLGVILNDLGRLEEAVASFRKALALKPYFAVAHSNLLMSLNYIPGASTVNYLDEARHFGMKVAGKIRKPFSDWTCSSNPEQISVGLVSGDLRNHPVGYFLENLLTNIDFQKINLIAFTTNSYEDELTVRLRSRFKSWRSLQGMSDEAAARLIHDDGVHVLLDLSGHTNYNRLPVFGWKPAPVQATWLGYSASTGIAEMDYIIADPISVPEFYQEHFTEKVWYLPETRLCFSPPGPDEYLAVKSLPALHNGYITFGSFQNLTKINDAVLAVWGRILELLPQARLRLQTWLFHSSEVRVQLQERLKGYGVNPERVAFADAVPRKEYLAAHAEVDIILDTFPFSGGTTTCEALWMGVPTVTLLGNTMIARQGASLLACAGLDDWICENEEVYVAKALTHAADVEKLARLRSGLRR
ncbi:MAG: tetratricopeptide repeat protein, partial [Deltaproteobacteria bacterium]|nr:tetratricopeptide repeat protein [Deltaproteobacteria bacterium]